MKLNKNMILLKKLFLIFLAKNFFSSETLTSNETPQDNDAKTNMAEIIQEKLFEDPTIKSIQEDIASFKKAPQGEDLKLAMNQLASAIKTLQQENEDLKKIGICLGICTTACIIAYSYLAIKFSSFNNKSSEE